ncbi:hypothetical protein VC83_07069 [Pseudogymnoascus destructans]|uniref:Amidoligase enzyme n=1 Tax=Pseudogymnoascus destructans TaxID=655981 RepID=A0A177A637_9PEZI|nr:uncharacterized protein VC83_07069 [Pseudogymnoascus destructans]OAF56731.1 hypothetical protein VC83_07069 [Pseudogymnoascus destructans]
MHNAINESYLGERYSEWSLDSDSTIETPNKNQAPWGLENISPIFRAYENSIWQNHVAAMWSHLEARYNITSNDSCGTHVHISLIEGYSLSALKRICQSIIYFEPAFEAILPRARLGNEYARSNWLDNPNFGYKRLSRRESMVVIEKCTSVRELVLLTPTTISSLGGISSISLKPLKEPLNFVVVQQARLSAMSLYKISKIPATVGGLKWFIEAAQLPQQPGLFDTRYINLLLDSVGPKLTREPKPMGKLSPDKLRKLQTKKDEDKRKNVMLAKISQPPYWG